MSGNQNQDKSQDVFTVYQESCDKIFDGMFCVKCSQFNEYMSNPNQDDGTYKCYKCRCGF